MDKRVTIIAAFVLLSCALSAQPQGARPEPPKMKDPAELAKDISDRMQQEVGLDAKQYKKVYNLYKKDFQYRQNAAQERMGGGMPPQGGPGMGGPGGGGMMGGGPGGMGGDFGGGMMGGGMSGQGMPPQGAGQGQRPEGGPGMGPGENLVTDEYLEKQDKKLRKILSPEQYRKWSSNHPAEHLELPPLEIPEQGK